ncbi:MAG: PEP-CTERM sorting domain-containing protein [Gomphosphaeria aponina SAG 52.96 = DSM 107014]|uniref:PEP-CTERM sorting domain-containing protein n=1 Tax=Gomphosphaeria aponina SAG 52.96 = DSM 107014 TaxID=1521640 RepID=A0A941JRQ8_9CHRO|nr:PEP-CTERM sorting domain-containing protein [Gomphosphaeria aponina SAG 52.96 = DSM 107014]
MNNLMVFQHQSSNLFKLFLATLGALNFTVAAAASEIVKFDLLGSLEDDRVFSGEFEYDPEAKMDLLLDDQIGILELISFTLDLDNQPFISSAEGYPGSLIFSVVNQNTTSAELELGYNVGIDPSVLTGALFHFDDVPTNIMDAPEWIASQDLLKLDGSLTGDFGTINVDNAVAKKTIPEPSTMLGSVVVIGFAVLRRRK